jgi:hypothetical protein
MKRPEITIHNSDTNETFNREMTEQEHAQYLIDVEASNAFKAESEAKATARISALAKLAALGLTADEIASL